MQQVHFTLRLQIFFTFQSGYIQIMYWLTGGPDQDHFTFQSGYIQILAHTCNI